MKRFLPALCLLILLCGFITTQEKTPPVMRNISYGVGEELEYRVHFGIFTVGRGITRVDKNLHNVNSRTCFKVDAFGETSDWISWVAKVDDNWGAYIDTTTLLTHKSYRKLREGKYIRDEQVDFDHENRRVAVKVKNKDSGLYEEKSYDVPANAKDLVAGFLFLRVVDFKKIAVGDTISISGFLEDASYNLQIVYSGKDIITTRVGKIQCLRLRPIMPQNSMFDGENSVLCWISDDLNRIPVKIQAKMFIGNTGLELIRFRGLRNPLKITF
jgi:Protein of unknown function (DUF3108)